MDLARRIFSRDLKIAAMREIDGGRRIGEVVPHLEVGPRLRTVARGMAAARGTGFPRHGSRENTDTAECPI